MARVKKNIVTEGLSGHLQKTMVFKHYGDRTIVSAYPDMSQVVASPAQKAQRGRMAEAMHWAKAYLQDPAIKAAYQAKVKGMQRAINVAVADFLHPPVIGLVLLEEYHGHAGESIYVNVTDDFRVARVVVSLYAGNVLIETGDAIQLTAIEWHYQASQEHPDPTQGHLLIQAYDGPGNETTHAASFASLTEG